MAAPGKRNVIALSLSLHGIGETTAKDDHFNKEILRLMLMQDKIMPFLDSKSIYQEYQYLHLNPKSLKMMIDH